MRGADAMIMDSSSPMLLDQVLTKLRAWSSPPDREGMARFGIRAEKALGVSIPKLRGLAREIGRNHLLAQQLWASEIHEARILASMVDDWRLVTEEQMEAWAKDCDSWDVVDQCCSNLFDKTPRAYGKAIEWSGRGEEFVKRAGFVLMAALAVHDKKADDEAFEPFFPLIEREAGDGRNFVKKAVNWALRQIGKRNQSLNARAIEVAKRIQQQSSASARWVASDALRELSSEAVRRRMIPARSP